LQNLPETVIVHGNLLANQPWSSIALSQNYLVGVEENLSAFCAAAEMLSSPVKQTLSQMAR
jgi:hypothetical protein